MMDGNIKPQCPVKVIKIAEPGKEHKATDAYVYLYDKTMTVADIEKVLSRLMADGIKRFEIWTEEEGEGLGIRATLAEMNLGLF